MLHEPAVRLVAFFAVLVAMALWEVAAPRRRREIPRLVRWSNNLAIVVLDTVLIRLTFPIVAVGLAVVARERDWGLFNVVEAPRWVALVASVLVLDLVIYLQHVMFHAVPALWRLHRMHHADLEFDVSTGLRFHPLEIALSMGIKLAVVAALGPPAVAVLVFEVLLNATAMFNHSNVHIPPPLDKVLGFVRRKSHPSGGAVQPAAMSLTDGLQRVRIAAAQGGKFVVRHGHQRHDTPRRAGRPKRGANLCAARATAWD